jgi:large subunit ribosomal protein L25
MSKIFVIEAEARKEKGKSASRSLRRENKIPAVVYGAGIDPVNISIDHKSTKKRYLQGHFKTQICQIEVDGKKIKTLPKQVDLHPVSDEITHIDFFKPNKKYKLKMLIPLHLLNEDKCSGVKSGGVLNIASREVEVLCTIDNIPETIEVDVAKLDIGSAITQKDLNLPTDVEFAHNDNDDAIVTVAHHVEEVEEESGSVDDVEVTSEKSDANSKEAS